MIIPHIKDQNSRIVEIQLAETRNPDRRTPSSIRGLQSRWTPLDEKEDYKKTEAFRYPFGRLARWAPRDPRVLVRHAKSPTFEWRASLIGRSSFG
jgi:hypothetical protein